MYLRNKTRRLSEPAHDIQDKLRLLLPHPAGGEAASRVGPKIALDHVRVYKKKTNYVCALWVSSPLVVYDAIDNASSSRATRTEK